MGVALEREAGIVQLTENNSSSSSRVVLQLLVGGFALLRFGCRRLCFKPLFFLAAEGKLISSQCFVVVS